MNSAPSSTLPPGPSGRSNIQLQSIINDFVQKEVLLGRHEMSLVPTKPVAAIEYESLKFEQTSNSVKSIQRAYRSGSQSAAEGPNCNKIGYKNAGLWSPRSIHLEQLMKPLLSSSVSLWPDYETINEMLSKTDLVSEEQLQFAMVDTLLVRMNEANEVRYGFDRMYSHWSYTSNQFEMRKEWVDKIELDILVLSLINDHTAAVQLKKEQANLGGMGRHTHTSTSAAAAATLSAASKIHQLVSALPGANAPPTGTRRKVLSEGECRTHAVLKAVCRDGSVHIRPLCTSGDVLLALHELLDPVIFIHGCIQLPHVLSDIFARHTEGYYRYVYTLNQPGQWQYLRIHLPAPLQSLASFVQPAFVQQHTVFHTEHIPSDRVPPALRQQSIYLTKLICKHYGKSHLLQRMVVDFEACMDITNVVARKVQKRTKFTSNGIVTIKPQSNNYSGAGGDGDGEHIPAPHLHNSEEPPKHRYFFRLLHIAETQFLQSWTGQRRDAVCYMHPSTKLELRNFEEYFQVQWELRKREFNRNRAALYMSHPPGGATLLNPLASPINTTTNANTTTSAMAIQSLSPHNRFNGSKDSLLSTGFSPISQRLTSYTPFLPTRTTTISPTAITASNSASAKKTTLSVPMRNTINDNYHGMLNQVLAAMQPSTKNGSILRPGSTLSAKHALSLQNTLSSDNNTSSKYMQNRRAAVSTDIITSRSKKVTKSKETESSEVDPAKLDAIHLVNVLFGRKYHKRLLRDQQKLQDSCDEEDSDGEEPDSTHNRNKRNLSNTNSNSYSSDGSSDVSDSEVESLQSEPDEIESESSSDSDSSAELSTVFRFIPGATANDNPLLPSAMVAQKSKSERNTSKKSFSNTSSSTKGSAKVNTKASLQRTGDRSIVGMFRPPNLLRNAGSVNFSANTSSKKRHSMNNGNNPALGKARQSLQLVGEGSRKHRHSVVQNPDQAILQRYHYEEKQRIEREARCAEVVKSWQDIQNKLNEEKILAEQLRTSVYFVARSGSFHSNYSQINSPVGSPVISSPSGTKGVKGVLKARKRFLEVGKTGKESKTTLGVPRADSVDSGICDEERRRARDDYLQQCVPKVIEHHNTTQIKTPYGSVPTTVDKKLYLSVDTVTRREHNNNSPNKNKTHPTALAEPLSPSKMYIERNKTPPALPTASDSVKVPKTRNDVEFNERAYKLAEMIDLTYLVSSFNPANHSKDKTILLDEDLALLKAAALSQSTLDTTNAVTTTVNNTTTTNAAPTSEPAVELTAAEKRQRAEEYAAFMKQLYDDEMALMMESLVSNLPNKLGNKVRKALAAMQLREKLKQRLEYIRRRRKKESLGADQVEKLSKFYEMQGEHTMTDSSSDDEAAKAKASLEMNNLLGDFAVMDEAQMKALVEGRAAEEQAVRDAEEAKRLRRASMQARKEAEAQAKADKLAAAAAAAEDIVYADEPTPSLLEAPEAPQESPTAEANRKGSIAQMRKTMRTVSLMQITKVLLDGTLIPQCGSAGGDVNHSEHGDSAYGSESESNTRRQSSQSSRPTTTPATVVVKRLNEFGELVDEEGEAADGAPRPRSRPTHYATNRPSLWGPSLGQALPVFPVLQGKEKVEEKVEEKAGAGTKTDNAVVLTAEDAGSRSDVAVQSLQRNDSNITSASDLPSVMSTFEQVEPSSADPLDINIFSRRFSNRCDSPLVDILTRTGPPPVRARRPSSTLPTVHINESDQPYATLMERAHSQQQADSGSVEGEHAEEANGGGSDDYEQEPKSNKYPFSRENTFTWQRRDSNVHLTTETETLRHAGGDPEVPLDGKERLPERKFSGGERIPSANISVRIKVRERGLSASSALEISSAVDALVAPVKDANKEVVENVPVVAAKATVSDNVDGSVPVVETLGPRTVDNTKKVPVVVKEKADFDKAKRDTLKPAVAPLPVPESVHTHRKAEPVEDSSTISTLTGPESELSRDNSELMDVQDLLKTLQRPVQPSSVPRIDTFVHRPALRSATVSNSVMTVNMEGRPPSGLVFNLVKPAALMKASPMDKVNSGKNLPFVKKPHKKPHDTSTPTKPVKSALKHDNVTDNQPAALKASEEALRYGTNANQQGSKGLYLIPGAAVASLVQKPSAEKPSRPIIYTSRVQMQQKLRDFAPPMVHDSLTVSTMTCSDDALPTVTVPDSPVNRDRFSFKSEFNDSFLAPEDSVEAEQSECDVEIAQEMAQLSGMFVDSCLNVTSVQLSTYDNSVFNDNAHLVVVERCNSINENEAQATPRDIRDADKEEEASDEPLQLNTEEWQLVLTAAREQASYLDFDILQQDEMEKEYANIPYLRAGSLFDAEMTPRAVSPSLLPMESSSEAVLAKPSSVLKGLSSSIDVEEHATELPTAPLTPSAKAVEHLLSPDVVQNAESKTSRLANIGEENFNWRLPRDRSVLGNADTDLLEAETHVEIGTDRVVSTPHVVVSRHLHAPIAEPPRAPRTLNDLLRQLGVMPLASASPAVSPSVSPSVSPGRARPQMHKNKFYVTDRLETAHQRTSSGVNEDSALHITKSLYANKQDIVPHRPAMTQALTPQQTSPRR